MKATNHPSFISPKGRRMFKLIALLMLLLPFGKAGMGYAQIITTVAGTGTAGYSGDGGQATNAELYYPLSITFDVSGNLYFSDNDNQRIRKVNTAGIITTIAGNGTAGYSGDGGQATAAELHTPIGVAFDAFGNLYIADATNHRIRKINPSGIISTIAGTGTNGYSGDGANATAAELGQPRGLAFDATGNLYFADLGYDVVRKVNTLGIITTIVGNGTQGYSGDGGQATAAELYWPWGIAFDLMGNMYIADEGNSRVRLVNTSGIITTIAGNGSGGYSGDGGQATAAEFADVMNVVIDASGNIYVSDNNNGRVRKINTLGIIITIAGNGGSGFSGMGGQATAAELAGPNGLALDAFGNLFFIDEESNHICKVTNVGQAGIQQVTNINDEVIVYPNPAATSIQVSLAGNSENTIIVIRDMLGNAVYHSTTNAQHDRIPIAELTSGMYIIEVSNSKGTAFKKFIKE